MQRAVALLAVCLLAVAIAPPPTPLTLSHVTTDSMEPTLSPGDGYLLVTGDVSAGDVVTYRTVDGEYVTHRVVARADGGWITKGDANPSTDQAAGAPPVPDGRVVGRVVTLGGAPLALPGLGGLASAVDRVRLPLFLLAAAVLAGDLLAGRERVRRDARPVVRVGDVVPPLLVGLTAVTVVVLTLAATKSELVYVVTETASGGRTLPVGEAVTREVQLRATRLPFTTVVASAAGAEITASAATASGLDLTLALPARSTVGGHVVEVAVGTYPTVLPRSTLARLHAIHPLVARLCTSLVVVAPFAVAYAVAFDGRAPLRHPTARPLRRWFR